MSDALEMLNQPITVKCFQCGKPWIEMPRGVVAMGYAPSHCPVCVGKFLALGDKKNEAGATITIPIIKS